MVSSILLFKAFITHNIGILHASVRAIQTSTYIQRCTYIILLRAAFIGSPPELYLPVDCVLVTGVLV